nr:ASCH domain-containing protein [Vibrio hippocampi]
MSTQEITSEQMTVEQSAFINHYLATLPKDKSFDIDSVAIDYFCADEYNANLCADLVLQGKKTATCSLSYWYEEKREPMPEVGNLMLVTRWDGTPSCIIQITHVEQQRYCDVTAEFAAAEGEGDQTLEWWRDAHWTFFSKECQQENIEMSSQVMLVLERFEVVFGKGC